jgi:pimeloyl-ACP methyl ester carboxylesterase
MKPDLVALYRDAPRPRRAVIFIPGAFGSRLRDAKTGRLVWGRARSFIERLYRPFHPEADLLDLPIEAENPLDNHDGLEPAGIFDKVADYEYYQRILDALRDAGGYVPGDIHDPRPGQNLFSFDYDWRRDAAETAGQLAEAIDRVLAARGEPGGKVDLVGHSLGGVLARYYARYGGRDVLGEDRPVPTFEGARRIGTVVFLGVPNEGTLDALRSLLEGDRLVRLLPPGAIFTMPVAYQLLPRPGGSYLIDSEGNPLPDDIYDVATWMKLGWSAFSPGSIADRRATYRKGRTREEGEALVTERFGVSRRFAAWALARARRFREALDGGADGEAVVRYVALGGDCLPTPARAMVLFDGSSHTTYFNPKDLPPELRTPRIESLMTDPGDGTVTRMSLLDVPQQAAPGFQPIAFASSWFLCATHRGLTRNVEVHNNLLHALLDPGR